LINLCHWSIAVLTIGSLSGPKARGNNIRINA
jgi:hypothetical protein